MIEGRPPRDRSEQGATTTSPQARKAVQEDIVNYQIKLDAVEQTNVGIDELTEPLTFPVEAYLSPEYARAEGDRLWSKVWQHAGRVEEIPNVGDFFTYEIGRDSIIVIRTAADQLKAFHNVCSHRARQLIDTPPGTNGEIGRAHV